jgi:hypothetical protein
MTVLGFVGVPVFLVQTLDFPVECADKTDKRDNDDCAETIRE